jgi:hypothetical protein
MISFLKVNGVATIENIDNIAHQFFFVDASALGGFSFFRHGFEGFEFEGFEV